MCLLCEKGHIPQTAPSFNHLVTIYMGENDAGIGKDVHHPPITLGTRLGFDAELSVWLLGEPNAT